jgi:hypothetical protein
MRRSRNFSPADELSWSDFPKGLGLAEDLVASKKKSLPELIAEGRKKIEMCTKFIDKINAQRLTCINNYKLIPKNVTIRREYAKCGKSDCYGWDHGPYYYAYWKDDNGKLNKKYIGKYPPEVKLINKSKAI